MQGAKKGLIVNSRDICKGANRAAVRAFAHNNLRDTLKPKLRARKCAKRRKRSGHRRR
jgi:hypothetical protein